MRAFISVFALIGLRIAEVVSLPPPWPILGQSNRAAEPVVFRSGNDADISGNDYSLTESPSSISDRSSIFNPSSFPSADDQIPGDWDSSETRLLERSLTSPEDWSSASNSWIKLAPLEILDTLAAILSENELARLKSGAGPEDKSEDPETGGPNTQDPGLRIPIDFAKVELMGAFEREFPLVNQAISTATTTLAYLLK
ncbi:hypothetical protein BJ085DRAFT_33358, partial [Dimargaris cristalligena]